MPIPPIHLSFGSHSFSYYNTSDVEPDEEQPEPDAVDEEQPEPDAVDEDSGPISYPSLGILYDASKVWGDGFLTSFFGQTVDQVDAGATQSPTGLIVGGPRSEENDTVSSGAVAGGEPGAQPVIEDPVVADDLWDVADIPAAEQFDDLDALDELAPDYAADSRLVDLVVKVAQAAVENFTALEECGQFFGDGQRILNGPWRRYVRDLLRNESKEG